MRASAIAALALVVAFAPVSCKRPSEARGGGPDEPALAPATSGAGAAAVTSSAAVAASARPSAGAAGGAGGSIDTIAIENAPGSTPVPQPGVAPAGPKAAGIDGAPGPSPAMGPAGAPVEVWIFSDFQCPVCTRAVEPMKHLVRSYAAEVRVVFKHNALPSHKRAAAAAAAAIAAQRQGKFWQFHDRIFVDQTRLSDDDLEAHARALGLDMARFAKDRAEPAVQAQIRYEGALADALDAQNTPSLFVNGRKQVGWGSYAGLASMVDAALRDAKPIAASGTPALEVARKATAAAGEQGKLFAKLAWGIR
jgi:protein-disulfide isomerase